MRQCNIKLVQRRFASTSTKAEESVSSRYAAPSVASKAVTSLSKTTHGISLATVDYKQALSQLSLIIPAGSKYQKAGERGAAHFLKNYIFKSNENESQLALTRNAELRYSPLSVHLTRDNIVVVADFYREKLPEIMSLFLSILKNKKFDNAVEFEQVKEQALFEAEQATHKHPEISLFDSLYEVAFRNSSLGMPLLACHQSASHLTASAIKDFKWRCLNSAQPSLVGINVSHEELIGLEKDLFGARWEGLREPNKSHETSTQSAYFGGEKRTYKENGVNHVMLGFKAAPGIASKDSLTASLISSLIGGPCHVKYGHGLSLFSKLSAELGVSINGFHNCHPENSLIGFHVCAPNGQQITHSLTTILDKVMSFKVDEASLARAKETTKFLMSDAQSTRGGISDFLISQITSGKSEYVSGAEINSAVDSISAAKVEQLLQELFSSKPSMASEGRLFEIPHLDDLQK